MDEGIPKWKDGGGAAKSEDVEVDGTLARDFFAV